jgi:hypothetical protein
MGLRYAIGVICTLKEMEECQGVTTARRLIK